MDMASTLADFQSLKLDIARIEGQREEVLKQYAKGHAYLKAVKKKQEAHEALDAALTAAQREASEASISRYSLLLGAIASDILGVETNIGLELSVDRSLPALDVFLCHPGGRKIDIVEGCGGSLSNIISVGLRLIASALSGKRQFLALDEPDCWLSPTLVPKFFRVLEAVADGAQIVVITHHDISETSDTATVIELTGSPEHGLSKNIIAPPVWSDGTPGIREIRLRGHSSFSDATIPLGPGLTIIRGRNNIGKSRIIRALRNVFYGESDDGDIRNGETVANVNIVFNEGMTLCWQRQQKRSPATQWRLLDANGAPMTLNGAVCAAGGRQLPEWVGAATGIAKMDGLDVQISHQKTPIFLLDKPSTQRAAVLAIGSEAGVLRDMSYIAKEEAAENKHEIRFAEEEAEQTLVRMEMFENAKAAKDQFTALEGLRESLVTSEAEIQKRNEVAGSFVRCLHEKERYELIAHAVGRIPSPEEIPGLLAQIKAMTEAAKTWHEMLCAGEALENRLTSVFSRLPFNQISRPNTSDMVTLAAEVYKKQNDIKDLKRVVDATSSLLVPPQPPKDTLAMVALARTAISAREALSKETLALSSIEECLEKARQKVEDIMNKMGNICPVCHTPGIHAKHILNGGIK